MSRLLQALRVFWCRCWGHRWGEWKEQPGGWAGRNVGNELKLEYVTLPSLYRYCSRCGLYETKLDTPKHVNCLSCVYPGVSVTEQKPSKPTMPENLQSKKW